jgi:hypothetical protein
LLFRLDVRDTQVGLKVFRREVADEVIPLLLVKQFAFDLELLTVARAFGFRRVRELPVRLDYQFTGSEVRSSTVARALWDTAAIFYRLRILRTYQRKRRLLGASRPPHDELPLVTVFGDVEPELDYPLLDFLPSSRRAHAEEARGEILAFREGRPGTGWAPVLFIVTTSPRRRRCLHRRRLSSGARPPRSRLGVDPAPQYLPGTLCDARLSDRQLRHPQGRLVAAARRS